MTDDAFEKAVARGEIDLGEFGNKLFSPRHFAEFVLAEENRVSVGDGFSRLRILMRLTPHLSPDAREFGMLESVILPTLVNDPVLGPYLPDFADGFWLSKVLQYGAELWAAKGGER